MLGLLSDVTKPIIIFLQGHAQCQDSCRNRFTLQTDSLFQELWLIMVVYGDGDEELSIPPEQ